MNDDRKGLGILGIMGVLIGGGCLVMAALGVGNTAFDWELVLNVFGADVEVPGTYEECGGVAAAGVLIIVLTVFGSRVLRLFREAKGKPLRRALILGVALILLAGFGRGLYTWAILGTYGSWLAYYATDGDLDDVRQELAANPTQRELDDAVSRAAQYDNAEALALVLEAGGDLAGGATAHPHCVLGGDAEEAFVRVAVEHGASPATCPESDDLLWRVVRHGPHGDRETAAIVRLLRGAGWSEVVPEGQSEGARALASRRSLTETLAALQE
ncbi:MAG: hypothetical protein AAGE52_07305 [Myxococcota bacterium]